MKIRPILNSLKITTPFLLAVIFAHANIQGQNITGFWGVKEVKVGEEIMTPVAKWTKINEDHTFQSGNGWLQNSTGTWTFDPATQKFLPLETHGITDEFGAFTVRFDTEKMIWERDEEGMKVIVTLEKISQMPMSTADQLKGLWDLTKASKEGKPSSYDPHDKHYIFIRWDRIFVERTPEGKRSTGYWHIHGHRPEITFISHDENKTQEGWRVSVSDLQLILTGISETNKDVELVYRRINKFPE